MISTTATRAPAPHYYATKSPATAPVPVGTSPTEHRRRYIVAVSSPELDLQGDRVLRNALDCAAAPPVPLLIGHDHSGLPVGTVGEFAYAADGVLRGTLSLPPAGVSAKADELHGLIQSGIGVQFSIGFDAKESRPNREGGSDFTKITLREISAVPVGAARGTHVVAEAKRALAAKSGTGYGDPDLDASTGRGDPLRDRAATARCPEKQRCMKYEGRPCGRAEACPLHLGGAGNASGLGGGIGGAAKRLSVWDKRAIPPAAKQMGHTGGEAERRDWAWAHGTAEVTARRQDEKTRGKWDTMKAQLLSMDPKDRPVLKAGVDISRQALDAMPADIRALVLGHLAPDARLEGM